MGPAPRLIPISILLTQFQYLDLPIAPSLVPVASQSPPFFPLHDPISRLPFGSISTPSAKPTPGYSSCPCFRVQSLLPLVPLSDVEKGLHLPLILAMDVQLMMGPGRLSLFMSSQPHPRSSWPHPTSLPRALLAVPSRERSVPSRPGLSGEMSTVTQSHSQPHLLHPHLPPGLSPFPGKPLLQPRPRHRT